MYKNGSRSLNHHMFRTRQPFRLYDFSIKMCEQFPLAIRSFQNAFLFLRRQACWKSS